MEFVVILFLTMINFNFWAAWETIDFCNNDIVDIYYPANKSNIAYDDDCPYTKTILNCNNCSTYFVRRSQYHKFAKSYTDLGMKPPFPQRHDISSVYQPKTLN